MDPLSLASNTAYSGLHAQSERMRIVSQNIANAEATGSRPGADPYRRRTVSFAEVMAEGGGVAVKVGTDGGAFRKVFLPQHEAADSQGYVKMPNVDMLVEMTDMRQALRSYEANLQVIRQNREMTGSLVDLLK